MLYVIAPPTISSPVGPLIEWVPHTLVAVAPELQDEINAVLDGYTFELLDEPSWVCSATPDTRTFRISTRVIEILWAQAYAAFVFFNREMAQRSFDGSVVEITDPEVRDALDVYRWALSRMIDDSPSEWPTALPRPRASPSGGDAVGADAYDAARELALMATGYLLLHEVAHIALKHTPNSATEWSIDEERDADAWASEWMLVRGHPPLDQLEKRALGVLMALLTIVSRGIHTGWMNGVTHPRDFDRLYNAFAHRIPDELDRVWFIALGILSLHLTAKELVPRHLGPFDTAHEAVNSLIDHLANLYERGG